MEANELLQNRNKCSREGARGVPHCWPPLGIPHETAFMFSESFLHHTEWRRWMDVTDVNELWVSERMAGGSDVILE